MKARWLVAGLIGWWMLVAWATAAGPSLTRGPYLQSTTPTGAIVVWQTDAAGDGQVQYGVSDFSGSVFDSTVATTHAITLTGLLTGTTYQYRILTGGAILYTSTLSTAPEAGGAFDFVVFGDSGTGFPEQYAVAARMQALDPDFLLHTGDVIYPSGQASGYDPYFFDPYQTLLDHIPIFPSLGNHDHITDDGQPYLEVFYLPANNPAGTERYYSFDWGDAHFVALDSTPPHYNESAMLAWLQADLAATAARWKFVFFHHALYTSGPHAGDGSLADTKTTLEPIFDQYDVDVVFNGHDHAYERSFPISGTLYIVTGGGGASLYDVSTNSEIAFARKAYHVVQVQITSCVLSIRAIDTSGAVFDQVALAKCPHRAYLPILLKAGN